MNAPISPATELMSPAQAVMMAAASPSLSLGGDDTGPGCAVALGGPGGADTDVVAGAGVAGSETVVGPGDGLGGSVDSLVDVRSNAIPTANKMVPTASHRLGRRTWRRTADPTTGTKIAS